MNDVKIRVEDLSIRFRLSYDKTRDLRSKIGQVIHNAMHRRKPEYFTALSGVSFEVSSGDIVGIIGPNGAGKSTLLRAVCGIYEPDEGSIECSGRISTLLSLGTGFDNSLNGMDNIRLNGLTIGMAMKEIEKSIPSIIEFADIGDHIYSPMKYYSSGMISRLSFAIVVAMKPDILLIDEVFSVGDLAFQKKSTAAMHELLAKATCQLIVTHNLSLVTEHCNRAIYIKGGKIIANGPSHEVVAQYKKESEES